MVWNVLWIAAMGASLAFVLGAFSSDPLLVDVVSGGLGVELRGDAGAGGSVLLMEGAVLFEVMAVAAFLATIVYMLANSMTQQIDLFPGDTLNYSQDTLSLHALQALHGAAAIRANIAGETDPASLNLKMRAVEQLLADYQTQSMGFAAQDSARQPRGKQQPSASLASAYLQNPANLTAPPNGKALRAGAAGDPAVCPSSSRAVAGAALPAGATGAAVAAGGGPAAGRQPNPVAAAAAPAVAGVAGVGAGAADALLAGGVPAGGRGAAQAIVERELKEKDLKDLKEAQRCAPSLAAFSSLSFSCDRLALGARHDRCATAPAVRIRLACARVRSWPLRMVVRFCADGGVEYSSAVGIVTCRARRNMAMLEMQAEKLFSEGDYEGALKTFNEITGSGGALLRWSDEEKFEAVRGRQAACSLALAHSLARSGQKIAAIKGYSETLALHSDSMSKDDIIDARFRRDECLLHHVRTSSNAEECAQVLRCVQRFVEVSRPATIDSGMWTAWRKKDKNLLLLLLEARIEQLRDYKTGSPTFRVGKEKFESVLRWCDQMLAPNSADSAPASAGASCGSLAETSLKELKELSTEVLLWLAAAEYALANSGTSDLNVTACNDALEYVEQARKHLGGADTTGGDRASVSGEEESGHDSGNLLAGCLGNRGRLLVCDELSKVVKARLEDLKNMQKQRAVEQEQVQRVLEEQRRLEEEAKTMKKKEAEERQRKAREERQRKEMERKQQQLLDKEEAVRKKAEEAAAKKREAEAADKKREAARLQEQLLQEKREEEERLKAEAAEKALTEAIQEAQARRLQQEKEREKEKEKENEREREREKTSKELKAKGPAAGAAGGTAATGKGAGSGMRSAGAGEATGQEAAVAAAAGSGGRRVGEGVKKVEKQDVGQMIQRVEDLVAAGNHEQVVEDISRLISTQVRCRVACMQARLSCKQARLMGERAR